MGEPSQVHHACNTCTKFAWNNYKINMVEEEKTLRKEVEPD